MTPNEPGARPLGPGEERREADEPELRDRADAPVPGILNPSSVTDGADVERLHLEAQQEHDRLMADAEKSLAALRLRAPNNLDEAIRRFRRYQRMDALPNVSPGLLSCSTFCEYITEAGILYPPILSKGAVQLASLDLPLLGKAVWYENGRRNELEIGPNTQFTLRRNSIAFVTLEPYLQLPDYIAMRFNLRVRHVYRGLLLGTGPLVDPGYQGYLSIPLHNLTGNDYTLSGGDGLVAVEFTKLDPTAVHGPSPRETLPRSAVQSRPFVVPFPEPRFPRPGQPGEHPIDINLAKANVGKVESSLSELGARIARQDRKIGQWTRWISIGGSIALVGLVLAIGGIMWQATSEMRSVAARERDTFDKMEAQRKVLTDSLRMIHIRLRTSEQAICATTAQSDSALQQLPQVRALCP